MITVPSLPPNDYSHAGEDLQLSLPQQPPVGLIVTCIEPHVNPVSILGASAQSAAMIRTSGGRVVTQVLDDVVLACLAFPIEWILILHHLDCRLRKLKADDPRSANEAESTEGNPEETHTQEQDIHLRTDVFRVAYSDAGGTSTTILGCSWDSANDQLALRALAGLPHPVMSAMKLAFFPDWPRKPSEPESPGDAGLASVSSAHLFGWTGP